MTKAIKFLDKTEIKVLELCETNKISISGVKYSRGHDADAMEANVKVGNSIKGYVYDDSWGGDLEFGGKEINRFTDKLNDVISKAPKYTFLGTEMEYCSDTVVSLLIKDAEFKKDCKKKIVVLCRKSTKDNARVDTFEYNVKYQPKFDKNVLVDMKKEGYVEYEIVNKRYI